MHGAIKGLTVDFLSTRPTRRLPAGSIQSTALSSSAKRSSDSTLGYRTTSSQPLTTAYLRIRLNFHGNALDFPQSCRILHKWVAWLDFRRISVLAPPLSRLLVLQ